MAALARSLYGSLLWTLTPAYLLRLWRRGAKEPAYRERLGERLGRYEYPAPPPRRLLWLHAVSLGETRAAAPLIAALRALRPDLRLLLTTSTATGWTAGHALLHAGDVHTWLPYDTPGAVRRFLRHHRPVMGVLMETEVWPNLLHVAQQEGVPMVLANARLSAKSQRQGERYASLMRPAAESFLRVLAQTQDDAQRLRDMGAPSVEVCGNLKFDIAPPPALLERGQRWRARLQRPVVLAASTRENEETPLLAAWRELPQPREPDVHALIGELQPVDWVLVEGFKHAALPKVEVWRAALGQPVLYPDDPGVIAVATDDPAALPVPPGALPVLALNSPGAVADRLLAWGERFNYTGDTHG